LIVSTRSEASEEWNWWLPRCPRVARRLGRRHTEPRRPRIRHNRSPAGPPASLLAQECAPFGERPRTGKELRRILGFVAEHVNWTLVQYPLTDYPVNEAPTTLPRKWPTSREHRSSSMARPANERPYAARPAASGHWASAGEGDAVAPPPSPAPRLPGARQHPRADPGSLARGRAPHAIPGCQLSPYSEPPGSGKLSHPGSPILSQAGSPMLSHPGAGMGSHPAGR